MKKYYYVYITTNLLNGKQYVGDRSCDCLPSQDPYLGSGRPYFKNALKKYGKLKFQKEILERFDNKQEAFNAQEKYIDKFNTLVPNGYNISPKGGMGVRDCHSKESKLKISKSLKKAYKEGRKEKPDFSKEKHPLFNTQRSEETREKISKSNKGKQTWLGKTHTEESKEKISKSNKGKQTWLGKTHTEESKEKIREALIGRKLGPHSEEHKKKISEARKGLKHSEETKRKIGEKSKERALRNKELKLSTNQNIFTSTSIFSLFKYPNRNARSARHLSIKHRCKSRK